MHTDATYSNPPVDLSRLTMTWCVSRCGLGGRMPRGIGKNPKTEENAHGIWKILETPQKLRIFEDLFGIKHIRTILPLNAINRI